MNRDRLLVSSRRFVVARLHAARWRLAFRRGVVVVQSPWIGVNLWLWFG